MQPSMTAKEGRLSRDQQLRLEYQLTQCFKQERPPADRVEVIDKTIRVVDPAKGLFRAQVRTDIRLPKTTKSHVSHVLFSVNQNSCMIADSLKFN
jgi:hypothetical protein